MAEVKQTRDQFALWINVAAEATPTWARLKYTEDFEMGMEGQTEEKNWVFMPSATEELTSYKPKVEVDYSAYEGDPYYDYIYAKFLSRAVGTDAKVDVLQTWPGAAKKAWRNKQANLVFDSFNIGETSLAHSIDLGGSIIDGTYAMSAEGVPTFTETPSS